MGAPARIRAGRVVLVCVGCDALGDDADPCAASPPSVWAIEPAAAAPRRRRSAVASVPLGAAMIGSVLLLATGGFATGSGSPAPSLARSAHAASAVSAPSSTDPDLDTDPEWRLGDEGGAEPDDGHESDGAIVQVEDPRFEVDGVLERFPSLRDWVHPVKGAPVVVPLRSSRKFGAVRAGERPVECGRGHCGIDLGGEVGTPVFAVAWGEVVRIERRADRRSGRYVKLRHPEGDETSYMHLDEIADGLRLGDEVEAGQVVGTLGTTGIHAALPHLHFSLAIPAEGSSDGEAMVYIDPVPFLRDATISR